MTTLISTNPRTKTRPCPFSGRYSIAGSSVAMLDLLRANDGFDAFEACERLEVVMHAGCSSDKAAELKIESSCAEYNYKKSSSFGVLNDAPSRVSVKSTFTCHGRWTEDQDNEQRLNEFSSVTEKDFMSHEATIASLLRSSSTSTPKPNKATKALRQVLMLSTSTNDVANEEENALTSRRFVCLAYTEQDGVLMASASASSCDANNFNDVSHFNITSSGPCLQALTSKAAANFKPNLSMFLTLCIWLVLLK